MLNIPGLMIIILCKGGKNKAMEKRKNPQSGERSYLYDQRFGKLVVMDDTGERTNKGEILWLCRCDCGGEIKVKTSKLTGKFTGKQYTQACSAGCGNIKDITGQKFNRLTAIKNTGKKKKYGTSYIWLCRCDCGNMVEVPIGALSSGGTKSCGCLANKLKDRTGDRYGLLTIIGNTMKKNNQGEYIFRCRCDCGTIIERSINGLRKVKHSSCGCYYDQKNRKLAEKNIGKKFNKLTMLKYTGGKKHTGGKTGYYCLCRCDCGNEIELQVGDVINERKKSCGCYFCDPKDVIGQEFNGLTIIKATNKRDKWRRLFYLCECSYCGGTILKRLSDLKQKSHQIKSCGCMRFYGKGGVWKNNLPLYDTYVERIGYADPIRRFSNHPEIFEDLLEIKCAYCGKWHVPTRHAVEARIGALEGRNGGECRLYCSKECKRECPTYHKRKYPAEQTGDKPLPREVQPELRQLVFERDNWTCIKCGSTKSLHCHHIEGIEQNPIESADTDICVTLCKKCHKRVHKQKGCGYHDLRKKECA